MDTHDLLRSHPELAKKVDALIQEELKAGAEEYAKEVKGYPKFVFTVDGMNRKAGDMPRVVNTFGQEATVTIERPLGEDAYLVRINDSTRVVAHEPWRAWE